MRLLRTYVRIAHEPHDCDRCMMQIMPGDQYEGAVYAVPKQGRRRKLILVLKQHVFPGCDWPPDPDEEEYVESRRELPLAA